MYSNFNVFIKPQSVYYQTYNITVSRVKKKEKERYCLDCVLVSLILLYLTVLVPFSFAGGKESRR